MVHEAIAAVQETERQAEQIVRDAEQEGAQILEKAKEEAKRILEDAENAAKTKAVSVQQQLYRESEESLQKEELDVRAELEKMAIKARIREDGAVDKILASLLP